MIALIRISFILCFLLLFLCPETLCKKSKEKRKKDLKSKINEETNDTFDVKQLRAYNREKENEFKVSRANKLEKKYKKKLARALQDLTIKKQNRIQKKKKRVSESSKSKRRLLKQKYNELININSNSELKTAAIDNLKLLYKLLARSEYGTIPLTVDSFNMFVNNGPRYYWTLLVFTALNKEQKCGICTEIHKDILSISSSYKVSDLFKSRESDLNFLDNNDSLSVSSFSQLPIFFMTVNFDIKTQSLFNSLNLKGVPFVALLPPLLTKNSNTKLSNFIRNVPPKYQFQYITNKGKASSNDLVSFINKQTSFNINVSQTISIADMIMYVLILLCIGIIVYIIIVKVEFIWPYFLICAAIYVFGISGGMYSILNDLPFSDTDRSGRTIYMGHRLAAEGYIIGALNLLMGFFVMLLLGKTNKSKQSNLPIPDYLVSLTSPYIAVPLIWFCFNIVRRSYEH